MFFVYLRLFLLIVFVFVFISFVISAGGSTGEFTSGQHAVVPVNMWTAGGSTGEFTGGQQATVPVGSGQQVAVPVSLPAKPHNVCGWWCRMMKPCS